MKEKKNNAKESIRITDQGQVAILGGRNYLYNNTTIV